MKKCYAFLTLVAVLSTAQVGAQQNVPEFGRMTVQEFSNSASLHAGDADAVVIYRNGRYSFLDDADFMSGIEEFPIFRNEFVTRIKILTDEGTRYGVFEFPYHNFSYNVPLFDIEGFTYNLDENGVLIATPLEKGHIEDVQLDGDDHLKRVTFPDVREGSVVELRCIQRQKYSRMPVWEFQQEIPVLSSELVYTASPYLGYAGRLKGASKYSYMNRKIVKGEQRAAYVTDPDHIVYTYGMNNMPAYPTEDYTNNSSEDLIRMVFDLVSKVSPKTGSVLTNTMSWSDVNTALSKNRDFGKYIKASEKEYSKIKDLPADRSVTGVAEAVYRHVRDNYRWNGIGSPLASQRASELVKKRRGNSADINLFLVGLLRGAGVDAVPVLINRRNSGAIDKEMPSENVFNYVMASAVIGGVEYFMDATESCGKFGELPERSANVEGLYMVPGSERWAFTLQEQFSYDGREAEATLSVPNAAMNVTVARNFEGNAAVNLRNGLSDGNIDFSEMLRGANSISVQGIRTENDINMEMPFIIKYSYKQPVSVDNDGNITIEPLLVLAPAHNPFTGTGTRRFRVDMPFRPMDSYKMRITVPEGYQVASLPRKVTLNDDISFFTYKATQEGNTIILEGEYYLCETNYPPAGYSVLKIRYDDMLAALSEKIVLTPSVPAE